jgi:hypothetical protein
MEQTGHQERVAQFHFLDFHSAQRPETASAQSQFAQGRGPGIKDGEVVAHGAHRTGQRPPHTTLIVWLPAAAGAVRCYGPAVFGLRWLAGALPHFGKQQSASLLCS